MPNVPSNGFNIPTFNHHLNFFRRYHEQLQILLVHSFNVEVYLDQLSEEICENIRVLEHNLVDLDTFEEAHGPTEIRVAINASLAFYRTFYQHVTTNVDDIRASSHYLRDCIRFLRGELLGTRQR